MSFVQKQLLKPITLKPDGLEDTPDPAEMKEQSLVNAFAPLLHMVGPGSR